MHLLDNVVRFIGDPVLALAADDEETAEEAISKIQVNYEVLEPVFDPFESLKNTGVSIHEEGNVTFKMGKQFGDIEKG